MKYFLIVWVCTFLESGTCGPAMKQNKTYDTWYDCAVAAHVESVRILEETGPDFVSRYWLGTRYACILEPSSI